MRMIGEVLAGVFADLGIDGMENREGAVTLNLTVPPQGAGGGGPLRMGNQKDEARADGLAKLLPVLVWTNPGRVGNSGMPRRSYTEPHRGLGVHLVLVWNVDHADTLRGAL